MATRELFNANTQKLEVAELSVDSNNEVLATFEDGSFLKFPVGLNQKQFDALIEAHQLENEGNEVLTPEYLAAQAAERANSLALAGVTEDSTSESQSNDSNPEPSTE